MAEPREYIVWVTDENDGLVPKAFDYARADTLGVTVKRPLDAKAQALWEQVGLAERFYPWHIVSCIDTQYPDRAAKREAS